MAGQLLLPPNLYLKPFVVTSTARYEVSATCHITMTANRDGKYYVSVMDLTFSEMRTWQPRVDDSQQTFGSRIQAEAWVAMLHKKERKILELRNSVTTQVPHAPKALEGSHQSPGSPGGTELPPGKKGGNNGTAP